MTTMQSYSSDARIVSNWNPSVAGNAFRIRRRKIHHRNLFFWLKDPINAVSMPSTSADDTLMEGRQMKSPHLPLQKLFLENLI